jgi:hypothetical protein
VSRSGVPQTLVRRGTAVCAAVLIAATIAACGDDDSGPTPDFTDVADDICLDTGRQLANARADADPPESSKEATQLLETQLPIRRDELERLQALQAPPDLVSAWDQYLELKQNRIDSLDDALAAAQDDDRKAYVVAQTRAEKLSDNSRQVAEQIGLDTCGEVLPPAGQEDVLATVEKVLTSPDSKKVCDEAITDRFAETAFGSVEKCASNRGQPIIVSLDLLDVGGIAATSAFVDVKVTDVFNVVRQQRIELVFDAKSKTWKVDSREPLVSPEDGRSSKHEESPQSGDDEGGGETTTTTPDESTTTTPDESTTGTGTTTTTP